MTSQYLLKTLSQDDFDRICRICLEEENLKPIVDTTIENLKVPDLLEQTLIIQVNGNEAMPQNICESCLADLYHLYEFIKRYRENEIYLKSLVKNVLGEENDLKIEEIDLKIEEIECKVEENDWKVEENGCKVKGNIEVENTNSCMAEEKLLEQREKLKLSEERRRQMQCEICQKSISFGRSKIHMQIHTKEKPFQCDICFQRFHIKFNLSRHKRSHTNDRRYVCSKCGTRFLRVDALKIHEKSHIGNKTKGYTCNECGHLFKRLATYKKHLQKHNLPAKIDEKVKNEIDLEERTHICSICQSPFTSKQTLNQHLLVHGERSFLCSFCGKSFTHRGGLQAHLITHTKEKPFACQICKKLFKSSSALKAHIQIHSGKKPYSCRLCSKSFTYGTHLNRHMKTHTGVKPFNCIHCGKSFSEKTNLAAHERTHTGERPYVCPICGKGFAELTPMKKHKRIHNKQEKDSGGETSQHQQTGKGQTKSEI